MPAPLELSLSWGVSFHDLHTPQGLKRLDGIFQEYLQKHSPDGLTSLLKYRQKKTLCSETMVQLAPWVEMFLQELFGNTGGRQDRENFVTTYKTIASVKRTFIQRYGATEQEHFDPQEIQNSPQKAHHFLEGPYTPERFARSVMLWMSDPHTHREALQWAACYSVWAMHTPEGRHHHAHDAMFTVPRKRSLHNLVPPSHEPHVRDGFNHTDAEISEAYAMDQAHTCLVCHHRGKDSCSSGMRDAQGSWRQNSLGVPLEGCPLGQKISEMILLKRQGWSIGALAVITIHNPLVAGTGHRICWDCARSCIFQAQEPVDIPALETQILWEVLDQDWGFELYALLTRWNPLKPHDFLPRDETGFKVLVVGMGPAGMMLSHELLNAGHGVLGLDGLSLEPLPSSWLTAPIPHIRAIHQPLEERRAQGFGGVMDYGITARWDKNLLFVLRLLLERRQAFRCYGSIRMGGTLTLQDSWDWGFDHVALCLGAGRPRWPAIPGSHLPGVRGASDFLMTLHSQEGFRWDTLVSTALDLPLVVIGGGLTAVDAATEAHAFYIRQVERVLARYETLTTSDPQGAWKHSLKAPDHLRLQRWLAHGRAIQKERQQAYTEGRAFSGQALIQSWGGVHILYRGAMQHSPAYRTHPQELTHALAQGVTWWPHTLVEEILGSEAGVTHVKVRHQGEEKILPCGSVLIATGLKPHVSLADEEKGLAVQEGYFQPAHQNSHDPLDPWTAFQREDGRRVTFLGDLQPAFHGSVVKAMASAHHAAPLIDQAIRQNQPASSVSLTKIFQSFDQETRCYVIDTRAYSSWFELVVHAPLWSRRHRPGFLYRLIYQTSEGLKTEAIPLSPVDVDPVSGRFTFWVVPCGASTHLLSKAQPSHALALMGPTGQAFPTPSQTSSILMIGVGPSIIGLLNAGASYREQGHHVVLWFSQVPEDMGAHPRLKQAADTSVLIQENLDLRGWEAWVQANPIKADHLLIAAPLEDQQHLQTLWDPNVPCQGLIQAPLQCMMKGVCGQCLQRYRFPAADSEIMFFGCEKTLHPPSAVDNAWHKSRRTHNQLTEKLNQAWLLQD